MNNIEKIMNGETAMLSVAQVVLTLVNMTDAKNNLSPNEFEKVYGLFCKYMTDQKMNELKEMNSDLYLETCEEIIKKFDVLVPFESYSGRESDDIEFTMFLEEIREEAEKERCMDKNYLLVKETLENSKNEYKKILEETFSKLVTQNNEINENKLIIEGTKKYANLLCKYILNSLDEENKERFVSIMNNPQEIDVLKSIGKPYFNTFGYQAGHILTILYYINNIEIDHEKCLALSKMQRKIMNSEIVNLAEKNNVSINRKESNSQTGCGVVIIFAIVSIVALSISTLI